MKLAVDAVVFAYKDGKLNVLMIKRNFKPFENYFALPGGFIKDNETAEDAIKRELLEETGIEINYLEQLYTFTNPNRDPRERIISLAYYGLINPDKYSLIAGIEASEVKWIPVKNIISKVNTFAFDHGLIVDYALTRLQNKIKYEPIGFDLLPEKFTLGELHRLYSTILDKEIERRNFNNKILKIEILEFLDEKNQTTSKGRKGNLFKFNNEKYKSLKINGFDFRF